MTFALARNSYGKSEIRLVKVTRDSDRHELCDVTVDVALEGDFAAVHATGDNSGLLATDTMRNTVYALAAQHAVEDLELFGRVLVDHFVEAGPSVHRARVQLVEHPWARLGDHQHAFQRAGGGERVAVVAGDGVSARVEAGIEDLVLLRTTGSGFEGFLRDRFTTLPETEDRILATAVSARWTYAEGGLDYGAAWRAARDAILATFADHYSPSVQFTLRRMGEAVLRAVDAIERVHLSLPNRHHLLYDLARFGIENDNRVFHASAEPYGLIEGTVERSR
ncbi:MAG TPA: urate oxidase [Solirubrobacteraceae bacterium]